MTPPSWTPRLVTLWPTLLVRCRVDGFEEVALLARGDYLVGPLARYSLASRTGCAS